MRRLAVDGHRLDALRDISLANHRAALARDAHPAGLLDALLLRQSLADLDEFLRLEDRIDQSMLGPEVELLGEAIGCSDIGEIGGGSEVGAVVGIDPRGRIVADLRVQYVFRRRLERLVMLWERPFDHLVQSEK